MHNPASAPESSGHRGRTESRTVDGATPGTDYQLDISEPDKGNALHGLVQHAAFHLIQQPEASITLETTIYTPRGYPFVITIQVS